MDVNNDGNMDAVMGSTDGWLYALAVETGELRWRYRTGSEGIVSTPVPLSPRHLHAGCPPRARHSPSSSCVFQAGPQHLSQGIAVPKPA